MDYAERLSVVVFSLLQINLFRLSLLQIHDDILENTPYLALKQLFHVIIFAPHLISSKFIPIACHHFGFLFNLNGQTSTDLYISFLSHVLSSYPMNPFSNYLRNSMMIQLQHEARTIYTQISLPISANRMVVLLKSSLENARSPLSFDKLFSSLIRQALTCDNTNVTLLNSPDIIPIQMQWNPDVINSTETEYLIEHISPTLLFKHLFPVVANRTVSNRIYYLYGMIVSINQIQLILFYTNDIKSWIFYDGANFQVIGYIWQDVLYFLQSNHCRPDLLIYTNPAANLLDATDLQRGLPEISHTKCNNHLNEIAVPILKELLDRNQLENPKSPSSQKSLVQDTVKEVELQCVAGSPIKIVLPNSASIDNLSKLVNLGSLDKLDIISLSSNYESSLQRRVDNCEENGGFRKLIPASSRPCSSTSPFRIETRASYHPFFTSLVVLWSIDLFRETLLHQEMILKTPDFLPLIIRIKEVFAACNHSNELTPMLPLFQTLTSRLLKNSQLIGSGTEVFDTILTLMKDELRNSINFQGHDPIGKSRLIQNIFTITLQESGKCRCGATYEPIEIQRNLLHLNIKLYLPHASKACNKYGNINNVPGKLAHKAIRDTLVLMNKRDCKSQSCNRTYLSNSLLVTAPRILCLALDYEVALTDKNMLLASIPTSLRIDRLFKDIGPNARACSLLYLTGVMAEISRDRVVHIYYHSTVETWVSVDGMGYKEVGAWPHVVEELKGLDAIPISLVYTNPLDITHHYKDPALVFPVSEVIRTMSAPDQPSNPHLYPNGTRSADTNENTNLPQYVTIEDINLNKKRRANQSLSLPDKITSPTNRYQVQQSDSSSETVSRGTKPPLPYRQPPSKESTDVSMKSGPRPAFESSDFSSVSDLSAVTTKSHVQPVQSATSKSDIPRTHIDGAKVKNKNKKGNSVTLLNKLNPKTYFKKKDKIRLPRVEQTTREYPPSSPRLSEILETPKPSRLATYREGSYTDHLNELFSNSPVYEQIVYSSQPRKPEPPFVSNQSQEGKNLGLFESVIQELELKHSPPKLEDEPQPRPRLNLQSNSTPVLRPRELHPHGDPFESSIAVHILLQMINFPSYSQSVLNFSRLPIKKHQIIQALSVLFKRAASANEIIKADIIEYLDTCMPSMLGSSDFDTGHRLFHQLHWSFQPYSEAFKDHYSLQIRANNKSANVEDVYFVGTKISEWLVAMEKSLNQKIPVTYNHKVMRACLKNLFQDSFGKIINSPDQFYVAVNYDIEVDLDLAFRLWNCIPTLLRLGDLCSSLDRKHSKHKPFYLTGIIARSDSGSLISYSYSENRRLWYSFDPNAHNDNNLIHWQELISYVTRHSIFPIALLYTSPQSRPIFSLPQELATTISHSTQTSLPRYNKPQYANSESSHSQSSSLHKVRYHTLTPHPSVSTTDISRNLPVQLLSTLLLNQGFTASVQSLSNDSCPAIRELRNLILTTFRTFSSRQHSVIIFAEQNLSDVGGDSPLDIYQELLSKLVQRNPALRSKLYLSVVDRSGEEAIASVILSLPGYMSQVAHIPQFSKLNPKKCKIALKPASSIGKKQIQNATNLLSLYVGEDNSNGDTISFLPSLLRLGYLGTVNPKCYVHHVSYYLTGIILKTKDNTYTSAVFLAPRNRWLLLEINSLSEGQEFTWAELCESFHSSPLSPVFCFYSNSNIMGQYSEYVPTLSVTAHSHPATLSSVASHSIGQQHDNQEEVPFITSPTSHLIDFSFTQPEDNFFEFLNDELAPTTSLTNMNPPPEIYQPSFQSIIAHGREDSPLLTFPPPPDRSPSPTIYILTPEQTSTNDTDFQLDIPTAQLSANELEQSFHLFSSAVTMLWHIPFFRHSVLLAPGHTCVGFSCVLCALKSLFALYYYSRSYALSSDAIYLAKKHGFVSTDKYQSIGEMLPDMVKLIDNTLKLGNYRLMNNFILKHDQGSLTVLPVSMPLLCENIMKLAITKKFGREDHPLLFSKALSLTLQFRQQLLSSPNVLILDFRAESELQHACFLGNYINLSDLVITKKRNNCYTTHFYLSSVLTSDGLGGHSTFSFHTELKLWIGYDGQKAIQFTTFANLTSYLINKRITLLSCLYINPSAFRPSPQDLPQQIVRTPEAAGESATISRMQKVEEESTLNKSSLYPSIPIGIGFQNLLEDYERNKQGVGKLTTPPNLNASAPFLPSQQFVIPPQPSNLSALPPSINPNHPYQFQAVPSYPDGSSFPATQDPHSLMTPPVNLAYPPFIFPSITPQPCLQYPLPIHNVPPQNEVPSISTSFPKFSFNPFPHSGKALSSQAATKLSDKLTETGQWANLYQSIPCIGESYEIKAFQQRQKQTNFSPGRAVLERIHNYQIPIEVLLQAFTQTNFQEGIDLLMDVRSYSADNLSVSSLSSSQNTPDESSSEDEDYNPDINSIRVELSTETATIPIEDSTSSETVEDVGSDEMIVEERDMLQRKHSEEEALLVRDYQEKMEEQEQRQKRELESLSNKQCQNISEFNDLNLENNSPQGMADVPQYISPPSLTNGPTIEIPAYPASFPPTKADMFYTQARDLYRESLNISDFSVAFSLCVQAQNKLDLALIEPDVRLDPVKKQAYSQLRHICHHQAVRLHRRSVLKTLDPNHQFKSPVKKQSNAKSKRVKFDSSLEDNQENSPPPEEQAPLPIYVRPILRPPPLTPSLYQSIPRPPPIGRAMREEDKENMKPPHRVDYPPSRKQQQQQQALPVTEPPSIPESPPSTPSTFSTISDDFTSSSSSRASSRSRKHEHRRDRDLTPTRPFFNEDHYTILDQFIRHRRDNIPPAMDHSELSRKLLDSKIYSRSISLNNNINSPAIDGPKDTTPPSRDYFKLSSVNEGTSEGVVPRIPIDGTHLVPEKCSVCRSDKFFTIKTMCPHCYTRYIRSTDLMLRSGADPTYV
ncbi:inactive ubiquitin carboxyl-terminal hydrolase 53 [Oopsacas minuta]|uniref:Inactive ubiquitin carboxyl-terminal hydrolase 53 n=1 Tax=Oopsacas minuta TaxID=111878 RepID=A0AAV7JUI0_9METZ|nr:inactive ubiquitin carboxyl-terminal hydrolase 53 [Oopsacas minuta]